MEQNPDRIVIDDNNWQVADDQKAPSSTVEAPQDRANDAARRPGAYEQANKMVQHAADVYEKEDVDRLGYTDALQELKGNAGIFSPARYAKHAKLAPNGQPASAEYGTQDQHWLAQYRQTDSMSRKNPFGDQYQSAPYRMGKHSKKYRSKDEKGNIN